MATNKNGNKSNDLGTTQSGSPIRGGNVDTNKNANKNDNSQSNVEPKAVEPTSKEMNPSSDEDKSKNKETTPVQTSDEKTRQDKLAAMKARNAKATSALSDPLEKLKLFDSTKAGEMKTKASPALGSIKESNGGLVIAGRNVGAQENEPDWSPDQMAYIRTMTETLLDVQPVGNTRRNVPDPDGQYVSRDEAGSVAPTEEAFASALDPNVYCLGIGDGKYDITGSPKFYKDVVMADKMERWLLTQWTSAWVVLEGVSLDVLAKQHRNGASLQNNRRIGVNFARIGLPKMGFGAMFNTLAQNYPGVMSQIVDTRGYYWMNASWGVSSFSATFAYNEEGEVKRTNNLSDVMRILRGKSALCLATVAISLTCGAKKEGNTPVEDTSSYGLSVKMHNAFSVGDVDYHGPPQQGSTGMVIPASFLKAARSMGSSTQNPASGRMFATAKPSLFGGTSQAAVTVKSNNSTEYMP